jgi:GNAT superfamily N-acetyltransferase
MERFSNPIIFDLNKDQNSFYWSLLDIMQLSFLDHEKDILRTLSDYYSNSEIIEKVSVCMHNQQILGGVIKEYNEIGKAFVIKYLAVSPEFRKQGIGRSLVAHVEDYARQCKEKGAEVECIALRARIHERPFYEKLDYRLVSSNPGVGYATMFKRL